MSQNIDATRLIRWLNTSVLGPVQRVQLSNYLAVEAPSMINFSKPIVYAHDCFPCPMCDEPICPNCYEHYADCDCPGPHSENDEEE